MPPAFRTTLGVAALCLSACSPAPLVSPTSTPDPPTLLRRDPARRILAADFNLNGDGIWFVAQRDSVCSLSFLSTADKAEVVIQERTICPERLEVLNDGTIFLSGVRATSLLDGGTGAEIATDVVAAVDRSHLIRRNVSGMVWVHGKEERRIASLEPPFRILIKSAALLALARTDTGYSLVRLNYGDETWQTVAGPFSEVDSFDVSPDEKEFVISGDQGRGLDVWVGPTNALSLRPVGVELFPERMVSWAPRGNKITYLLETGESAVLRTVHVPSGFQVAVAFDMSDVQQLFWEPRAERYGLVMSSLDASSRVNSVAYGGEAPATLVPPDKREDLEAERLPNSGHPEPVLLPVSIRYGERYPLIIWTEVKSPYGWSDTRHALRRELISGALVTPRRVSELDAAFWKQVQEYPWVDSSRIYLVSRRRGDLQPMPTEGRPPLTFLVAYDKAAVSGNELKHPGQVVVSLSPPEGVDFEWFVVDYLVSIFRKSAANGTR